MLTFNDGIAVIMGASITLNVFLIVESRKFYADREEFVKTCLLEIRRVRTDLKHVMEALLEVVSDQDETEAGSVATEQQAFETVMGVVREKTFPTKEEFGSVQSVPYIDEEAVKAELLTTTPKKNVVKNAKVRVTKEPTIAGDDTYGMSVSFVEDEVKLPSSEQ